MLRRKKDKLAVEEFCSRVREGLDNDILAIKLFGSKLTDTDTPESDIDLFIVVREKTAEVENRILDIAFELDLKHDVYLSPRIVAESVLKHPVWRNTPFIRHVEHGGASL